MSVDKGGALGRTVVRGHGGARNSKVAAPDLERPTVKQLGLTKQQIERDRQLRDAEARAPGVTKRTVEAMIDAGKEPTRAALKRAIVAVVIYGASAAEAAERAASAPRASGPNQWEMGRSPSYLLQLVKQLADYKPDEIAQWEAESSPANWKKQLASARRRAGKAIALLQHLQETSIAD